MQGEQLACNQKETMKNAIVSKLKKNKNKKCQNAGRATCRASMLNAFPKLDMLG